MSSALLSLMFAAGVAGWTYSQMYKRVGGGNPQAVTTMVIVAFIISFIVFFTFIKYVLGL